MVEGAAFCREASIGAGEPIAGTAAADTYVWLVLEYAGPWGAKALPESTLPEAVKARLEGWMKDIPGARVQFVRGTGEVTRPGELAFFVADSRPEHRAVVRLGLPNAEALLELDLPDVLARLREGREVPGGQRPERPMMLVCTNGKRDRCCAKWGTPVYQAACTHDGVDVWQTTHLGGHRFAATLLWLPDGICFGRVTPGEVPELVAGALGGELYRLDRVRGRTALDAAGQAGEVAWLGRTGSSSMSAVAACVSAGEADRRVVTITDSEGRLHELRLRHHELGTTAVPSCAKPEKMVAAWVVER